MGEGDIMINEKIEAVVAIGASAGGLDALKELFRDMPNDERMTFIVIQHIAANFRSMMPELLAKVTDLPVREITDGDQLEPATIYLAPQGHDAELTDGALRLIVRSEQESLHLPIDRFFTTLAENTGERAVAVILSGTGSDGTRGLKAIKEKNGMVMLQTPDSAGFSGMPESARRTGLEDMVLPPKDMGKALLGYLDSKPDLSVVSDEGNNQSEREASMKMLFSILQRYGSIDFSRYKSTTVARRIQRRMSLNRIDSLTAYIDLLNSSPAECRFLIKEFLIGVTSFFRDREVYKYLEQTVIPDIYQDAGRKKQNVRVWISGCSTGEEAYSIAMLLMAYEDEHKPDVAFTLYATDANDDYIALASQGIYTQEVKEDLPGKFIQKYLEPFKSGYRVVSRLRNRIVFANHNMLLDPPFSSMDLISCRNVLIYFDQKSQQDVLGSFYYGLKDTSYLLLGASETPGELKSSFTTSHEKYRVYRKIPGLNIISRNRAPVLRKHDHDSTLLPVERENSSKMKSNNEQSYLNSALEKLISMHGIDCIILNDQFEAVHVYGELSPYLKRFSPGRISNNIRDILKSSLVVAVTTALISAKRKSEEIYYQDVELSESDESAEKVDIVVMPISLRELQNAPPYYVVQFVAKDTGEERKNNFPEKVDFDASEQARERIADLERELTAKQEHLQITIEELETTNEELQSANEELMTANEELQSTNEELQSVNEELYTVNGEYQEKIGELTESNDDLDSVMNATDIGIVFLDDDLRIRKYTPPVERYMHLRPGDVDRPIHHISHDLLYPEIMVDISNVSKTGSEIEKTITNKKEQTILIRILPYVSHRRVHELPCGVLITITNISRQKFVEDALKTAQEKLRSTLSNDGIEIKRRNSSMKDINILVLDDDEVDRQKITRLLKAAPTRNFNVIICSDIPAAVEKLNDADIHLCIVDYNLAGGTAKDFVAAMKESGSEAPLIILSGYNESGLDADFLNSDIDDFINKDELSSQLLIRSIDYVMERSGVVRVLGGAD